MIKLDLFDILVDSKYYNLINNLRTYKSLESIFITQNYYNLQTNSNKLKEEWSNYILERYIKFKFRLFYWFFMEVEINLHRLV